MSFIFVSTFHKGIALSEILNFVSFCKIFLVIQTYSWQNWNIEWYIE